MPGPGGTAVTSTETLQSAPSARSFQSRGRADFRQAKSKHKAITNLDRGRERAKREAGGGEIQKGTRSRQVGCRFRSSEKPMSGQERPHGRFPGPVKDGGGLGRGRKGDTSACDAGLAPGKGEQEGHGARRASACGKALKRSLPGSREGPEQSSVCVSGSAGPAQDAQCARSPAPSSPGDVRAQPESGSGPSRSELKEASPWPPASNGPPRSISLRMLGARLLRGPWRTLQRTGMAWTSGLSAAVGPRATFLRCGLDEFLGSVDVWFVTMSWGI